MGAEHSGFGAAQAAPSLVENSELRRAELAVLEWAEFALENQEDLNDFIDHNRDLRDLPSVLGCSGFLSRLVWLVKRLENARIVAAARRIETGERSGGME